MGSIEELDSTLRVATGLLDAAAAHVRDIGLSPVQDHIRLIGEALMKVAALQDAIYQVRPELKPAYLEQRSPNPDADRRLTLALVEAYR